jgi:hypothetical protein
MSGAATVAAIVATNARRERGGRLARMPRAVVWLVLLVVGLGLYLFVVEPGLERYGKDVALAETREARLREYAKAGERFREAGQVVSLGVRKFGEVAMPGDPQRRPLEFGSAMDEILRTNQISDVTTSTRRMPMAQGALPEYVRRAVGGSGGSAGGANAKVEREVRKMSFAATPEQFASALAAIEQHPLVATISDLRVRHGDGDEKADRKLRIDMDVETWVTAAALTAAPARRTSERAAPAKTEAGKGAEKSTDKTTEKASDKPADKPADKAPEGDKPAGERGGS